MANQQVKILTALLWLRKERMLKPYYHKIQAVRITRKNYQKLKELDVGDGVLDEDFCSFEDVKGDWFVVTEAGNEIMSGDIKLTLAAVDEMMNQKTDKKGMPKNR